MKTCTKCHKELELSNFNKNCKSKDGYATVCKHCQKLWREQNKEYLTQYNLNHRDYYRQYDESRKYDAKRIAYKQAHSKIYYEQNIEQIKDRCKRNYNKEYRKQYYQQNKNKILTYYKEYYQNNKESIKLKQKLWREQNKDKLKDYDKQRNKTIARKVSHFIHQGLRKTSTLNQHWENTVYYDFGALITHLEGQFTSEMNWNNYGSYWEIDHIIPQCTLPFTSTEDLNFKICWSLLNLRPLTVKENRSRPKDGSDVNIEKIKQQIIEQIRSTN